MEDNKLYSEKKNSRKTILAALTLMNFCSSAIYMWSIFNIPIMNETDWAIHKISFAYSTLLMMTFVGSLISGQMQKRVEPRKILGFGVFLWSTGWFLSGYANSYIWFYVSFGIIAGAGNGFVYNMIVSSVPRVFPDRRGLANGIVLGAGGLGPLFLAPFGYFMLNNMGAFDSMKVLGVAFMLVMSANARLVKWPKISRYENNLPLSNACNKVRECQDKNINEMIRDPNFYFLWFMFFSTVVAGLIMTGHASNIGQELAGLSDYEAMRIVGVLAVMSFVGRMSMGIVADKIGSFKVIGFILMVLMVDMYLFKYATSYFKFMISLSIVGFCFGSVMCVFPKACSEFYGVVNFGSNWSILFSGYTMAAFIGPVMAAYFIGYFGTYDYSFIIVGLLLTLAMILYLIMADRLKNGS